MQPEDVFLHINMHDGDTTVCWEWLRGFGGRVRHKLPQAWVDGIGPTQAYKLVYAQVHGPIPVDPQTDRPYVIRHSCDNPKCCNPHHMKLGTHRDNMHDMAMRKRHGFSAHVGRLIKQRIARGDKLTDIARDVGVSLSLVSMIKHGHRHADVVTPIEEDTAHE